jgi:predicted flap endonuclease-1-like 5' DNA nuclease
MKIIDVEGIGAGNAAKLEAAGVATTDDLLSTGGSARGRDVLAAATGISAKQLLEWVNHADLMRLDGVGSEYADLLEAAGVDSPAELARRNAANLATTFQEVVAARPTIVRRIPSEETVAGWIAQAKGLDTAVTH